MNKRKPNSNLQRHSSANPIPIPQAESGSLVGMAAVRQEFQGPIPPPELLRGYDEIVPGAADRIITVMEKQVDHRIAMERTVITGDNIRAYLGIAAGFVFAMTLLVLSAWLIVSGFTVAGTVLGGLNLAGIVGVFIYGTRSRRQERREKREQTQRGRRAA